MASHFSRAPVVTFAGNILVLRASVPTMVAGWAADEPRTAWDDGNKMAQTNKPVKRTTVMKLRCAIVATWPRVGAH